MKQNALVAMERLRSFCIYLSRNVITKDGDEPVKGDQREIDTELGEEKK